MGHADANRDLLFGILALQNGFIDQPSLIAAFHVWSTEKSRPISQILQERGDLAPTRRNLLEALVEEHIRQHGGETERSLASLSSVNEAGRALVAIDDDALHATLAHVGAA